jgi:hypothetical protein
MKFHTCGLLAIAAFVSCFLASAQALAHNAYITNGVRVGHRHGDKSGDRHDPRRQQPPRLRLHHPAELCRHPRVFQTVTARVPRTWPSSLEVFMPQP